MKILLITLGTDGDIDPFIALGQELKRRNHRVILVSNDYFKGKADEFSLEFVSIGSKQEYLDVLANPDVWNRFKGFRLLVDQLILRGMRDIYEQIKILHTPDTIIVAPCFMYGARIARDKLGIPLVTVVLQPTAIWTDDQPPTLASYSWAKILPAFVKRNLAKSIERFYLEPLVQPETNRFRSELGLSSVSRVATHWQYSPDLILALFPKWFGPVSTHQPQHLLFTGFVSHEIPQRVDYPRCLEFLASGDRPIAFTAGSGQQHAQKFYRVAVEACQKLNARGILLTKFRANRPAQLPESILHCDYAPFLSIFPKCRAVVHHGGIGTTGKVLASGVPQLVMPMAYDQPDNARRLRSLGVARFLNPMRFTPDKVAIVLENLLGSRSVRSRCQDLADRIDFSGSLDLACSAIESVSCRTNESLYR